MTATEKAPTAVVGPVGEPVATPAIYGVRIAHTRSAPLRNTFAYQGHLWLVDLDDLDGRQWPRWLRGQLRFEASDHLGDPGRSLKENVVEFARAHGVEGIDRVVMLASARTGLGRLSYVFNPLSTHWCYRADGTTACVVAEVHNTYGERHAYLLRPDAEGRAEVAKEFYVSPFFDVSGRYLMRFSAPGEHLSIGIALQRDGGTPFSATVRGTARPATVGRVLAANLRQPLVSLRFSALIRVQGIRMWLRRLPVVPRPVHTPPVGVNGSPHTSTRRVEANEQT